MKKIIASLLLTILAVLLYRPIAFATNNEVRIDELNLSLSIPDSYSAINYDTPADDPVFEKIGTTKDDCLSYFKENNIFLNCVSNERNDEIVVTMVSNSISGISNYSDTLLDVFASTIVDRYKDYGIAVSKYEIYQQSQAKFIKIYYYDENYSAYGLQFYTIFDSQAMNFTLRSYEGKISSAQENTIISIVNSIKFDGKTEMYSEGADTSSFIYEDNDAGIRFTVPNNWEKAPLLTEQNFIDVKFSSTKEEGLSILFGATDLWSQMSDSERKVLDRTDCNDFQLTASDIAEIFEIDSNEISEKTFNNNHYYLFEVTSDKYGFNFTTTNFIHIQNGWVYLFEFLAPNDSPYYNDFETMLNSVYISDDVNNTMDKGSITSNTNSQNNSNLYLWVIASSTLVLTAIIIVIFYVKKKRKNHLKIDDNICAKETVCLDENMVITDEAENKKAGLNIKEFTLENCEPNITTDYTIIKNKAESKTEKNVSDIAETMNVAIDSSAKVLHEESSDDSSKNNNFVSNKKNPYKVRVVVKSSNSKIKSCSKCGATLDKNDIFCRKCGTRSDKR